MRLVYPNPSKCHAYAPSASTPAATRSTSTWSMEPSRSDPLRAGLGSVRTLWDVTRAATCRQLSLTPVRSATEQQGPPRRSTHGRGKVMIPSRRRVLAPCTNDSMGHTFSKLMRKKGQHVRVSFQGAATRARWLPTACASG